METGCAARAIDHGRLQVVEDDGAGTASEKVERIDNPAVKLRLTLRQCEFDIDQPAVAKHGHEDGDPACGGADLNVAALAPIDLHRLGGLIVDFLVDTSSGGAERPQVAADGARTSGIAIGTAGDLLVDAYCREIGIPGQERIDLVPVGVQETGSAQDFAPGGLVYFECRGHGMPRTMESS